MDDVAYRRQMQRHWRMRRRPNALTQPFPGLLKQRGPSELNAEVVEQSPVSLKKQTDIFIKCRF